MKALLSGSSRKLIDSAVEALRQGEELLGTINNDDYCRKLPVAFNASIGGHYRHCLDHFRILLEAAASGEVNYDHRERGTLIESDRFAAINATRELWQAYEKLDPSLIERSIEVTCKTSYASSGPQMSPSTVGREVMYSVAHAVHHYALISVMGGILGIKLPPGFGVAPSTLKHQQETATSSS